MNSDQFKNASEFFYNLYSNPRKVLEIKEEISDVSFNYTYNFIYQYIYNVSGKEFNFALKQYLISRYYSIDINKAIIFSVYKCNIKFLAAIPFDWLLFFKKKGVNFVNFSHIYFIIKLSKEIIKSIYNYFCAILSQASVSKIEYVYFFGINSSCLPSPNKESNNYNLVNWYLLHNPNCREVRHSVHNNISEYFFQNKQIKYQKFPFDRIDYKYFFKFSSWFILSFSIILFALLFGRWKLVILFPEAVLSKWFSYSQSKASDYVFSLTDYLYRPLWTYNKKCKISFLSYSSSFHQFKTTYGEAPSELGYKIINWPEICVFTENYANWLSSLLKFNSVNVKCVNTIWFSDTKEDLENYIPKNNRKNLAVFDVPPVNMLYGFSLGSYPVYRTYENCKDFLADVYEIAIELNLNILLKSKRDFSKDHDQRYIDFFNEYSQREGVYKFPSDASSANLSRFAHFAVSAPFTSTAFMMGNIPSTFYDPTGLILNDDPGRQGKPLFSSKDDLKSWIMLN